MIARLTGKVLEREEKALILDVNGVGYRAAVLPGTREKFGPGKPITLRIYHHTGQEAEALYGFETQEQLDYFELLLSVPSIGPKTAMGILQVAPPRVLEQAVGENDVTLLTKVSGVGKKTAERILIELKGKIKVPKRARVSGAIQHEAFEALVSIGFTPAQARDVTAKLPKSVKTVEEAVKEALKTKSQ